MIAVSRILIVDDHPQFRSVLRQFLSQEPDLQIVGEAGSLSEAIQLSGILSPHLVLTDLQMPDTHGVEAVTGLRHHFPEAKILVVSSHREDEYRHHCHKAGASGYIVKDAVHAELRSGIRAVLSGRIYPGAGAAKKAVPARVAGVPTPASANNART
jgi:DNA-binding NarL/FixJ family response regulator